VLRVETGGFGLKNAPTFPHKPLGISSFMVSAVIINISSDFQLSIIDIFMPEKKYVFRVQHNKKIRRGTKLNCTPFVRQYDILKNKRGVF